MINTAASRIRRMRQRRGAVRNTCRKITQPVVTNRQSTCVILSVFLKYVVKERNQSMYNFNVATADCSYMFRLLQSSHHQAVYQTRKTKIIFDFKPSPRSARYSLIFGLFSGVRVLYIHIYVCTYIYPTRLNSMQIFI